MEPPGFEWDERKRRSNLSKHGIDFRDIPQVFSWPLVEDCDIAHSRTEERWSALGYLDGRVVFLVYTERKGRKRIITARPATPEEAMLYFRYHLFGAKAK